MAEERSVVLGGNKEGVAVRQLSEERHSQVLQSIPSTQELCTHTQVGHNGVMSTNRTGV